MATDLVLPHGTRPSNLHLPAGATATLVDGDVYAICERVREVDPALKVILLEGGGKYTYAIVETAKNGEEMLVFRVKELDARVIEKLQRMMSLPLSERLKQLEKEEYKFEADELEKQHNELYEKIGAPMWGDLERCGFIQRPISYPKVGVAARGKRAR